MADKEITEGAEPAVAPTTVYPDEKAATHTPTEHFDDGIEATGDVTVPDTWKYRERKIGPITIPWYASPKIQLGMVAFVCFLCPGMFNALGGMGGGGKTDATTADNMVSFFDLRVEIDDLIVYQQNTALYSTFAVFGFFGGTFVNRLGVRWTLAFGGIGYCIYAIALLVSVHSTHTGGFNIFAGALLGVCAGLLWTAQGTIMISYPHEHQKGRYFGWFWGIFNMGAVIGGLVCANLPFLIFL
jgi:MFS family permease